MPIPPLGVLNQGKGGESLEKKQRRTRVHVAELKRIGEPTVVKGRVVPGGLGQQPAFDLWAPARPRGPQ